MKSLLLVAILTFSSLAISASLDGKWNCSINESSEMAFDIEFIEETSSFARHGKIDYEIVAGQLSLVINTVEEGTYIQSQDRLKLNPLRVQYEITQGKDLLDDMQLKAFDSLIKNMLNRDEVSSIKSLTDIQFVTFIEEESQTNICTRA